MSTRILSNGAVYDNDKKRIIANPGGGTHAITSDTARDMVAKRVEKYRRAALKRIVGEAQSIDPDVSTAADAFGILAAKQYTVLLDTDKPALDHMERLHKLMTGVQPQRENATAQAPAQAISVTAAQLLDIADQLAAYRQHLADQARALDGTTVTRSEKADEAAE